MARMARIRSGYVCQPLVAQNNLMGLLYREACGPAFAEGADQLATMLAEQVSLALANLDLREQLRSQAIRDQLTGLYNRRFLEDALTREPAVPPAAAGRGRSPFSTWIISNGSTTPMATRRAMPCCANSARSC
jgi:FOG: GGDEF domain